MAMRLARGATVCLVVSMLCSVQGGIAFSKRVVRERYCDSLRRSINSISGRCTALLQALHGSRDRAKVVRTSCEKAARLSETREGTENANSDKVKLVVEQYNAIRYIETQVIEYKKDVRELLNGIRKHCGFWSSFMPVSSELKREARVKLWKAKSLVSKMEVLSREAETSEVKARTTQCSSAESKNALGGEGDKKPEKEGGEPNDGSAASETPEDTAPPVGGENVTSQ
ncbi:uncharacterized protein TEOVI_000197700 [Trypanosoma equiperdum]|uniref:Uncharacterized protein n=1 Tax=Trypanosoma equiperdum TaxID=5694 RepID=A0A1G4IDU7_TRYEQ|nr:hypothetical protein, conserved [Trypanosoma equiperdum]